MVWTARIIFALLLVSAPAGAQELACQNILPDNAAPAKEAPAKTEPIKSLLPEKPAPHGNFVTRPFYDKKIMQLAVINAGAAVWDDVASRIVIERGGYEKNPFMRPFVHNSGTLAVESVAEVWLMAYVADRMKRSGHSLLRKSWWLPQTINIAAKVSGGSYNTVLLSR